MAKDDVVGRCHGQATRGGVLVVDVVVVVFLASTTLPSMASNSLIRRLPSEILRLTSHGSKDVDVVDDDDCLGKDADAVTLNSVRICRINSCFCDKGHTNRM